MAVTHRWRFFRAGGFDQVRLDSVADLAHLAELDPKLWVALSCPVVGLEFDARTLACLDADGDGHVRVPDLLGSVRWTLARLVDGEHLVRGTHPLPLDAIERDTDEGRRIHAAARRVLSDREGSPDTISCDDTADLHALFAAMPFNGDGVVPPTSILDQEAASVVDDLVRCYGGSTDRGGAQGVDAGLVARACDDAERLLAWHADGTGDAVRPLGDATAAAVAARDAVRAKIDDFLLRCRLVGFDPNAAEPLNPATDTYRAFSAELLATDRESLRALPIARIGPAARLPLRDGANPAWTAALAAFETDCVTPLLGARDALDAADWDAIAAKLAGWDAWRAARPDTPLADLEVGRLRTIVAQRAALEAAIAADLERAPEAEALDSLDRLVRYVRDLARLCRNFVSFRDFYAEGTPAVFQAGTLYIDGRSCELVVHVTDPARHATLAGLSRLCLVYCDCRRADQRMQVVAAVTAGDSDRLIAGRNGVLFDRAGRDWDATILKVVENDISIRQAFWGPYRRAARMIGEQLRKFAAARAQANEARMVTHAVESGAQAATGKAPPPPFDVGKFAGIFAAIGLAIGAIGTALAAIVAGILGLVWWKIPLLLIGIVLAISGPAMLLAWLRLRQRNLGPLLDANGWAINARALINIPFGSTLTQVAELPEGAERTLTDPYAERAPVWPWLVLLLAVVLAVLVWWLRFRAV